MLGLLAVVTLFLSVLGKSDVETITSEGYPAEEHNVTTADGYILSLQRIPFCKSLENSTSNRKAVFLMHGLLTSSNIFIHLGSEYAIAYNLAAAGYDVWMGNARGNSYSRRHVSLDPDTDKYEFFDFTYEQIALYDLPAMIDYVLDTTKQDALHYISFAEGGTAFNVLCSMNTTYQSKFTSAHLLSGLGYEKNYSNKFVQFLSSYVDNFYNLALRTGYVELKPSSIGGVLLSVILVKSLILPSEVDGSSVKHAVHLIQNVRDKSFCRYNYGAVKNLFEYGSTSPPSYDLSKIKVNVTFHYSVGDIAQNEKDVLEMVNVMPNAIARKLARDDFTHLDYIISKDMKELVSDYIIEAFQNFDVCFIL